MILYSNIKRYDRMAFDDYLRLPGYSHSALKNTIGGVRKYFDVTENVRVGSIVDSILTEPQKANMNDALYTPCRELAAMITKHYGCIIQHLEPQVSYTADMSFNGLTMPVTGRLDYLLADRAVIDLKVTFSKDIDSLIDFMGYQNQGWHYTRLSGVKDFYLMICRAKRVGEKIVPVDVTIRKIDVSEDVNTFWLTNLVNYGKLES